MKTRTAAGFILVHQDSDGPRYLLLLSQRTGNWLPPKGHADDGETVLETALRETEEETGITEVNVIDGFEESIEYEVSSRKRGNYHKRVTYLLGTTSSQTVTCSDEHEQAAWFTLEEALKHVDFDQMREVLHNADAFLRKLG